MKNKKRMFANSNYGGGILYNKNAFTLIELLAIIVVLAIIAVITVPIILNIIENSKKGAAQDSAYGFKDAVNKYYIQELQTSNKLKLDGTYTVNSDGSLTPGNAQTNFGDDRESLDVSVSGTKPSSGKLRYSNNVLNAGCVVIGDYKVTFGADGKVNSTEKGDCTDYSLIPTIASCPSCVYIYTTDTYAIEGSDEEYYHSSDMPEETTNDYTTLTSSHSYFIGLVESTENPGKIGKAFVCGIEGTTPFCLEGHDKSLLLRNPNVGVLNTVFNCNVSVSDEGAYCYGTTVDAADYGDYDGYVSIYEQYDECSVNNSGALGCAIHNH